MSTAKPKTLDQLADQLSRAHARAIGSIDTANRCTPGTATWRKHFERYERRCEEHDELIKQLREWAPAEK